MTMTLEELKGILQEDMRKLYFSPRISVTVINAIDEAYESGKREAQQLEPLDNIGWGVLASAMYDIQVNSESQNIKNLSEGDIAEISTGILDELKTMVGIKKSEIDVGKLVIVLNRFINSAQGKTKVSNRELAQALTNSDIWKD